MKYKHLTSDHLQEIIPFYIEAFNAPPWNDKWTEDTVRNRLTQMIHCEGFDGMVCYEEGQIVGMILGNHEYYYDGMHFQIKEFCTSNLVQGKGVGSQLLETFTRHLRSKGIDEIILLTTRDERAEGFYQKRGFTTFKDMVIMGKNLKKEEQ